MWKKHILNINFNIYRFDIVVFIACKLDNSCELAFLVNLVILKVTIPFLLVFAAYVLH